MAARLSAGRELRQGGSLPENTSGGSKLSGELLWIMSGQLLAGAGAILSVKWLSRSMPPAQYGIFGLALTASMLVQQTVAGPIAMAGNRYFTAAKEHADEASYLKGLVILSARAIIGMLAIALLSAFGLAASGRRELVLPGCAAGLYAVLYSASIIIEAVNTGARQRAVVALHQALTQWGRGGIAFLSLRWLGANAEQALAGYCLATLLILPSQTWFASRALAQTQPVVQPGGTPINAALLLRFAWPFASWGLVCWMQMASDRWFLALFRGPESAAGFTVVYQLGYYPITLVSAAISSLVMPILYQRAGIGSDPKRLAEAFALNGVHIASLFLIGSLILVGAGAFHHLLFGIMTSARYFSLSPLLWMFVVSSTLFAIGQALSLTFMIRGDTDSMLVPKILTALAGTVFNMAGAYWFGVGGAAVATFLFSSLYLASVIFTMKKAGLAVFTSPRAMLSALRGMPV